MINTLNLPELNKDQLIDIINEENLSLENTVSIRMEGNDSGRYIRFLNVVQYIDPITLNKISYADGETVFKLINLKGIKPFKYFISKNGYILSLVNKDCKTKMILMSNKLRGNRESIALIRDKSLPNPNKDKTDNHYYTSIHKLVKLIWDPNDVSYKTMLNPIIKHIDGNNYNNNVNNLVWIEKTKHNMFGEENDRFENNFNSVDEIKSIAEEIKNNPNETIAEMAKRLNVSKHKVSSIKFGESWRRYTGINKGDFKRAPTPKTLTEEEVRSVIDLLKRGKTNVEISNTLNVELYEVRSIRNKTIYSNRHNENFISVEESYYSIPVDGTNKDKTIYITGEACKAILLNNIIPYKYYINKEGIVYDINWPTRKAKILHLDKHINGKKSYNQYSLRRKEGDYKDKFVVRKEDLVQYFWNPPTNYTPKSFDMLEVGNRDREPRDEYTGEKIKRPSPMTREDAENIAKYIIDHNETNLKVLSEKFGFSKTAIGHLKSGDTFKDINDKYNLKRYVKRNSFNRLTDEQVLEIANYTIANPNASNIEVAKKFNVHKDTICHIKRKSSFAYLLERYNFNIKPRQSFTYLERCDICKKRFIDNMKLSEIARIYDREPNIIKNFLKSKFAEWWKQTYYINTTIPQFQYDYFVSTLINTMNNGKGVTPFDVDMKQKYASVTGKGLTPFDIK